MAKLTACRECKWGQKGEFTPSMCLCEAAPKQAFVAWYGVVDDIAARYCDQINTDGHCKFFEQKEEE